MRALLTLLTRLRARRLRCRTRRLARLSGCRPRTLCDTRRALSRGTTTDRGGPIARCRLWRRNAFKLLARNIRERRLDVRGRGNGPVEIVPISRLVLVVVALGWYALLREERAGTALAWGLRGRKQWFRADRRVRQESGLLNGKLRRGLRV